MKHRLGNFSLDFTGQSVDVVERLQRSLGLMTRGEVVSVALGFLDWARHHVESGRSIAVVDHEKSIVTEFSIPFDTESAQKR